MISCALIVGVEQEDYTDVWVISALMNHQGVFLLPSGRYSSIMEANRRK